MKFKKLIFVLIILSLSNTLLAGDFYYFGMVGHGWLDAEARKHYGASPYADWNKDDWGRSNINTYSLMWDEPVCHVKPGYDVGYQANKNLDPSNSASAFSAQLSLRHGWINIGWFKQVCVSSSATDPTYYTVANEPYCEVVTPSVRVCFKRMKAPYSLKSLYPWMAKIYLGLRFQGDIEAMNKFLRENDDGKKLFQVIEGNEAFIERGHKTFDGIDLTHGNVSNWMPQILDKNKPDYISRYIAPMTGRDMICARVIRVRGMLHQEGSDGICDDGDDCLVPAQMYKLIKCVLVPLGPPPHPFTPYIVGDAKIFTVPNKDSTYDAPIVRIAYIENAVRKFHNCVVNTTTPTTTCNIFPYELQIELEKSTLCTKITRIGIKNTSLSLGCQARGNSALPILEADSIISGGITHNALKIKDRTSGNVIATLRPIDSIKYKTLFSTSNSLTDGVDYKKYGSTDIPLTVFQAGFKRNPQTINDDIKGSAKKMCQTLNSSNTVDIEYVSLVTDCESLPSMIDNTNVPMYACSTPIGVDPIYVANSSLCLSTHGLPLASTTPILMTQCKNGDAVPVGKQCKDIITGIFYEHDNTGRKICLRDFPTNTKPLFILKRNTNNPSDAPRIERFVEAEKVLMPLDANGNIDFTKQFKPLNSFPQTELDYFEQSSEDSYIYRKGDDTIYYRYGPRIFQVNGKQTTYLDYTSTPYFLDDNEVPYQDLDERNMCVTTNTTSTPVIPKPWKYTLQMPGYYANYDINSTADEPEITPIKSKLMKIVGGIKIRDLINNAGLLDAKQREVLLLPTSTVPSANSIVGIIDENSNRNANLSKINTSFGSNFSSFNFYPDFFKSIIKTNKIAYMDGTDLTKPSSASPTDNLFDTSGCNTIDFEMWGGGSNSRAAQGTATNLFDFTTANSTQILTCDTNSPGQNGGYLKGRFKIRYGSKIRILVGSAAGSDTQNPYYTTYPGSSRISTLGTLNHSDIWVTDSTEGHVKIASTDSVKSTHECQGNPMCTNLSEDELTKDAINKNTPIVQKDDNTQKKLARYEISSHNIKSLTRPFNSGLLNENEIQIDEYRGVSTSSYCGSTVIKGKADLFTTMPLSYPVTTNNYIPTSDTTNFIGYTIDKALPDLTRSRGTGNFNEIGSYFFINTLANESASNNPFGFEIDWLSRLRSDNKSAKCESRIKACFNMKDSSITGNKMIYGGNASTVVGNNTTAFNNILDSDTPDPTVEDTLVTDMNLYCPGLGGCYKSDATKGISQPGTHGLVKIECFQS